MIQGNAVKMKQESPLYKVIEPEKGIFFLKRK